MYSFYVSVVGLGGCFYVKGVIGNVVIEDVVFMLNGLGLEIGIDLDKLVDVGVFIFGVLGCLLVLCVVWVVFVKCVG